MKPSDILIHTVENQASGVFYKKNEDGTCSYCAGGVLLKVGGLDAAKFSERASSNNEKWVHMMTKIYRKVYGIPEEIDVKCPLCDTRRISFQNFVAHLNNKSGHGLSLRDVGRALKKVGY